MKVSGSIPQDHLPVVNDEVVFMAPRAADRRTGYSAQGYAFASEDQAFEGTPNRGTARVAADGSFVVELRETPSAYHLDFDRAVHPPHVVVMYMDRNQNLRVVSVDVPSGITPSKSLTHDPERTSPEYYVDRAYRTLPQIWYGDVRDGARTQEEILRASVRRSRAPREQPTDGFHAALHEPAEGL